MYWIPLKDLPLFLEIKGFFRCDQCISCRNTSDKRRKVEHFSGISGQYYDNKFITCHTRYVHIFSPVLVDENM